MKHDSKTFCMHPFTGLATREDGAIKICCKSAPIGFIQNESLEDAWNNKTMQKVRRQILNDERPDVCKPCWDLEDQGVESLRQRHIKGEIPEARINLYPNTELKEILPFEFPTMEIKLNNLCNLKCRMCHPMDSTSWNDWEQVVPFYKKENNFLVDKIDSLNLVNKPYLGPFDDSDNWWNSFEKLLPHFRRVEFAGGEPLMDPQHYKILDMLKPYAKNIEIKYATNLTMLGKGSRTVHDYWPQFKSIAVNVSIDGYGPSYEYIRGNAKWDTVIENIKEIQKFSNISRIVGAVAVQVSNAYILPKMIEYFLDDLGIVFYTNMVSYPECLSIQALPKQIKEQVTHLLGLQSVIVKKYKLVQKYPILHGITITQINNIINFMNSKDRHNELWQDTINFNMQLDATRNQSFLDVNPEFKLFV